MGSICLICLCFSVAIYLSHGEFTGIYLILSRTIILEPLVTRLGLDRLSILIEAAAAKKPVSILPVASAAFQPYDLTQEILRHMKNSEPTEL